MRSCASGARLYERLLSQTLSPSEWWPHAARPSTVFAIEGGRPLAEFPIIAHAFLTLRLLTGRLRFDEVVRWLRMPFLDGDDVFAGAAVEACLRDGRKTRIQRRRTRGISRAHAGAGAGRARRASAPGVGHALGRRRAPAEWAPRLLAALRQLGWHGTRALRSDEQQTVNRWHALLDEYSALAIHCSMFILTRPTYCSDYHTK